MLPCALQPSPCAWPKAGMQSAPEWLATRPSAVDHRHLAQRARPGPAPRARPAPRRRLAGGEPLEPLRPVRDLDDRLRGHRPDAGLRPRHGAPDREVVRLHADADLPARRVARHDRVGGRKPRDDRSLDAASGRGREPRRGAVHGAIQAGARSGVNRLVLGPTAAARLRAAPRRTCAAGTQCASCGPNPVGGSRCIARAPRCSRLSSRCASARRPPPKTPSSPRLARAWARWWRRCASRCPSRSGPRSSPPTPTGRGSSRRSAACGTARRRSRTTRRGKDVGFVHLASALARDAHEIQHRFETGRVGGGALPARRARGRLRELPRAAALRPGLRAGPHALEHRRREQPGPRRARPAPGGDAPVRPGARELRGSLHRRHDPRPSSTSADTCRTTSRSRSACAGDLPRARRHLEAWRKRKRACPPTWASSRPIWIDALGKLEQADARRARRSARAKAVLTEAQAGAPLPGRPGGPGARPRRPRACCIAP